MGKRQRKRLREGEGVSRETVPMDRWSVEQPFDSAEYMREEEITYGGEPMEPLLPSREEYQAIVRKRMGLPPV